MKLSECKMGVLVIRKPEHRKDHTSNIGHVVGLSANSCGEVIPLVLFATMAKPTSIHHGNLDIYED